MRRVTRKQKEVHYEKVAEFLKWLHERNGIVLAKTSNDGRIQPLDHREIEKLMSQYSGTKLTIMTPMSEGE